jgi:hypothetical protein
VSAAFQTGYAGSIPVARSKSGLRLCRTILTLKIDVTPLCQRSTRVAVAYRCGPVVLSLSSPADRVAIVASLGLGTNDHDRCADLFVVACGLVAVPVSHLGRPGLGV